MVGVGDGFLALCCCCCTSVRIRPISASVGLTGNFHWAVFGFDVEGLVLGSSVWLLGFEVGLVKD